MTTFTSSSTKRSTYKDDAASNDIYVVDNTIGSVSKGLALNGQSNGDTIQIDGLASDYNFKANGNKLTVTSVANPQQAITVQLSKAAGTAGDTLQFNDGNITADYVPASVGVKAALSLTSANSASVTLSGYKATLANAGDTLSYATTSTGRSTYIDSASSDDLYVVGNSVGNISRGLILNGQSNGDTIKIDGLASDYNFKANGNTLTVTSVADPKQIITVQLNKQAGTTGDTLQFNDGNITADFVPASGLIKAALNLTSANGESVTLSNYKATLADQGATLSYATSDTGRSTYIDNASSDDNYVVGNTSKGLILNGKSDGDTIQVDGLSTDFNFKANGNKLTITNIANPQQIITLQLDKLEGSNGDRIEFNDGVIMADYTPKVGDVAENFHLTGANGANVTLTSQKATLATLDNTFGPTLEVVSGKVAVDYLQTSTVFADANGNGVWDADEAKTVTDASGSYTLNNPHGNLVTSGGTDITTGLAFGGALKAPEGATVVNPLTTLQSALVANGLTVAAAEGAVGKALGLDISTIELYRYDPIAEALDPASSTAEKDFAVQVQGESVKVANLMVAAGDLLVGAAGGTGNLSEADAFAAVIKALAAAIQSDADGIISLTDTALLQSILTNAVTLANDAELTAGVAKVTAVKADFATMLADSAANIDAAVDAVAVVGTAATLVKIGQIGAFTQGVMADAIQTGAAGGSLATIVNTYTGTTADTAITATDSGQLDPDSTADDAAVAQGNTAPAMSSAAVSADGNSIVVTYSETLTGTPEAGDYAITLGSGSTTVTGATMGTGANANQVTLALGATVGGGNTASITYTATAGTANSIKDAAATPNSAATQTLGSVSNGSTVDLTPPAMSSAAVSADGLSIVVTYLENLTGTPEAGDYAVTMATGSTTVTGATIGAGPNANQVTLTLSKVIDSTATASNLVYTASAGTANSIKDAAPALNSAVTQTLGTITNNSAVALDATAPTMSSAAVSADGRSIVVTYSEALTGTPEAGDYGLTLGAGTTTVTGATIGSGVNANKVTLTLSNTIDSTSTASNLVYTATAGTANSIKDEAITPNNAATQTLGTITNGSAVTADVTSPTMSSALISAVGDSMVITYSELLTGTPEAADYAITLGTGTTNVTSATLGTGANANQVTLVLSSAIDAGNAASVAYTAAAGAANSIKDAAVVANNAADQTLASGSVTHASSSFVLTTGLDNITGTSGNDTFTGTYDNGIATDTFGFAGNDILNGAGGAGDKLHIDHLVDVAISIPDALWTDLSNIEKIEINTTGSGAQTIVTGTAFNAAFAAGVDFTTATSGSGAINITMDTFTHPSTLTTTSIAGAQTIVTGSGVSTVSADSTAGALTIYGVGLTSVSAATTTGAGAQTIGDASGGGANLVTVTANSNSGAQTITSTSTSDATVNATSISGPQTIVTGTGNDTVNATAAAGTNNTITTNAGNDTIVSSLGDDLITGGLGADTMTGGGGSDTFAFGPDGSVIGTSRDIITDFNTATADILDFGASTSVLAPDATATVAGSGPGSNVQTSAGGVITFDAGDNNLTLKIAAVQADVELDVAGSVAMFVDGGNTYVYYAGVGAGNADDQLVQLSGITTLATITGGNTTMIA